MGSGGGGQARGGQEPDVDGTLGRGSGLRSAGCGGGTGFRRSAGGIPCRAGSKTPSISDRIFSMRSCSLSLRLSTPRPERLGTRCPFDGSKLSFPFPLLSTLKPGVRFLPPRRVLGARMRPRDGFSGADLSWRLGRTFPASNGRGI